MRPPPARPTALPCPPPPPRRFRRGHTTAPPAHNTPTAPKNRLRERVAARGPLTRVTLPARTQAAASGANDAMRPPPPPPPPTPPPPHKKPAYASVSRPGDPSRASRCPRARRQKQAAQTTPCAPPPPRLPARLAVPTHPRHQSTGRLSGLHHTHPSPPMSCSPAGHRSRTQNRAN
uniref:Uncharacterized protein n=1 Tax=Oryza brachyantha TaxID=4533 RepID=J3MTW9_ORYBR